MTSLTLLEQNSSLDEKSSSEVGSPSPPDSPVFPLCPPPAVGTDSPREGIRKAPSLECRALAVKERTRLGFPDRAYTHAAHVFQTAQVENPSGVILYDPYTHIKEAPGTPHGDEANAKLTELWAYELAFNALKFQQLMEDVLIDSCFYPSQQTPDDLMSLVVVLLYDLQERKFQSREPMTEEGLIEEVRRVERSLFSFRTKLAASLARCRIKQNLPSIDDVLPKHVKEKHQRKSKLPLCTWINTLKTSMDEVCKTLRTMGFVQVDPNVHLEGNVFCRDAHCPDVLLFPQRAQEQLAKTSLLRDQALIIQAKYHSLTASAARPLFMEDADILMAGRFSAQTVAHVAVLASACGSRVHVCGVPADPVHRERLRSTLLTIGCKNVQFLSGELVELKEWDVQKVRVILLMPCCTASGLSDPIAYIISENGDRELLKDLSRGTVLDTKLDSLVTTQMQDLSHALNFPKVQAVVYCTCSVYPEENELLVKSALEKASVRSKLRPFRAVSTGWREEGEEKLFRMEESDSVDGCFICVLKRDEQEEPETVQDILARAAAKGLLNGLVAPETSIKKKKRGRQKGAMVPLPPLVPHGISETTRLSNGLSVPESACEELLVPTPAPKQNSNSTGEDSSAELSTTLNQASEGAGKTGTSEVSDATSKQLKGLRRKLNPQRQTKNNLKSCTTKKRRSRPSHEKMPRRRPTQRQTNVAPMVPNIHPLLPPLAPVALKLQHSRRTSQEEFFEEVPAELDLNRMKPKQDGETFGKRSIRSSQVVLPPILGNTKLSSDSSSHLSQSSTSSMSTSLYLSSNYVS